jgi:hypothetical protein
LIPVSLLPSVSDPLGSPGRSAVLGRREADAPRPSRRDASILLRLLYDGWFLCTHRTRGTTLVVGTGDAVRPITLCLFAQGARWTGPTISPPLTVQGIPVSRGVECLATIPRLGSSQCRGVTRTGVPVHRLSAVPSGSGEVRGASRLERHFLEYFQWYVAKPRGRCGRNQFRFRGKADVEDRSWMTRCCLCRINFVCCTAALSPKSRGNIAVPV